MPQTSAKQIKLKFPITCRITKIPDNINRALHFLCGFLQDPMIDPGSLHDKIGNQHNGATSTTQEYMPQNVEHSLGKAAPSQVYVEVLNC